MSFLTQKMDSNHSNRVRVELVDIIQHLVGHVLTVSAAGRQILVLRRCEDGRGTVFQTKNVSQSS